MVMNTNDLAEELMEDLRPHVAKLNLKGFAGIAIVDMPNDGFCARVMNGRVEFNYSYFSDKIASAQQGDAVAYADLLNTFHHELCHIDIDNKMPFLVRHLNDDELFPLGTAFRFTREFLACSGSLATMTQPVLKAQIAGCVEQINVLSKKQDLRNYSAIVCALAYLVGNCIHAPCGYFVNACSSIEDNLVVTLARRLLGSMFDLESKLPLETEDDLSPLCDIISAGWHYFKKSGG